MVAEIFHAGATIFAGAVGLEQPCDAHTRANGESCGTFAKRVDSAHHLMTGN